MKKLILAIGLGLFSAGSVAASCIGPFCWDDSGVTINGVQDLGSNGVLIPSITRANVLTLKPAYAGQMIFCTGCLDFNNQLGVPCVSTGTAIGGFIAISSATAVSVCK